MGVVTECTLPGSPHSAGCQLLAPYALALLIVFKLLLARVTVYCDTQMCIPAPGRTGI